MAARVRSARTNGVGIAGFLRRALWVWREFGCRQTALLLATGLFLGGSATAKAADTIQQPQPGATAQQGQSLEFSWLWDSAAYDWGMEIIFTTSSDPSSPLWTFLPGQASLPGQRVVEADNGNPFTAPAANVFIGPSFSPGQWYWRPCDFNINDQSNVCILDSNVQELTVTAAAPPPAPQPVEPSDGAVVAVGANVTLGATYAAPSTLMSFEFSSSPTTAADGTLSGPLIDAGLGERASSDAPYTFTSTKATASAGTLYWVGYTDACNAIGTCANVATPVQTLVVAAPKPTNARTGVADSVGPSRDAH